MEILEVKERTPLLIHQLVEVWEKSVRATQLFLSDDEIIQIKGYVPQALIEVTYLVVAFIQQAVPIGFMDVENQRLEMLFITPEERGKGLGKELLKKGIQNYAVNELTVNEQNPQAKSFYEHMGFKVYKRTDIDELGYPYPLLYMYFTKGTQW